ncbi:PD-(D/E)XK nuclease superfamily protein [Thermus sp.]|nr:PD-(D/E)XK nuclease superfamily protein [Thermus sp.]MCX7850421.1 hypothetical protein [Thermus sp.]
MPSAGDDFRDRVKGLVEKVIREKGLSQKYRVEVEYPSPHGSAIREQGRKVDIAVLVLSDKDEPRPYLFLECKWQAGRGTAEDKIFRAAEEARRDRLLGVHSVVVLGGEGFGPKMRRWALTEGFVHERFLEAWLEEFFNQ